MSVGSGDVAGYRKYSCYWLLMWILYWFLWLFFSVLKWLFGLIRLVRDVVVLRVSSFFSVCCANLEKVWI